MHDLSAGSIAVLLSVLSSVLLGTWYLATQAAKLAQVADLKDTVTELQHTISEMSTRISVLETKLASVEGNFPIRKRSS